MLTLVMLAIGFCAILTCFSRCVLDLELHKHGQGAYLCKVLVVDCIEACIARSERPW
jgi:hypothetical protein